MAGTDKKSIGYSLFGYDISASKALKTVGKNANTLGKTLTKFGKTALKSFAVAGAAAAAYAVKVGVEGVKAAIEDEAAHIRLAKTLRNVTKATRSQIVAVGDYIDKTQLASGFTDSELRPSLDRLVRSTKNIAKAQQLQGLAMDISAATGKDLATTSEALAKGYDGNLGALKRIGVSISAQTLKSKDFNKAQKELTKTFGGQAKLMANTLEFRLKRLSIAYDEAKEKIGVALMPLMEKFSNWLATDGVRGLDAFIKGLVGENGIAPAVKRVDDRMGVLQKERVKTLEDSFYELGKAMRELAKAVASLFATDGTNSPLVTSLSTIARWLGNIEDFFLDRKRGLYALQYLFTNPTSLFMSKKEATEIVDRATNTYIDPVTGRTKVGKPPRALGGPVSGRNSYLVGERGPEILHMGAGRTGYVSPNIGGKGTTVVVNVQGSVVSQKDLSKLIRDDIAQLMRRQGAATAVLGVGR